MPASSMCSMIAPMKSLRRASTSISMAASMAVDEQRAAREQQLGVVAGQVITQRRLVIDDRLCRARPARRTDANETGYPTSTVMTCSGVRRVVRGCQYASRTFTEFSRSSARSMARAVPGSAMPARLRSAASDSGV